MLRPTFCRFFCQVLIVLNLTLYFSLSHPGFLGKKSTGNAGSDLETDSHCAFNFRIFQDPFLLF